HGGEELRHHRRDSLEMTGTRLAFERLGDAADVDPGARPWRIHQLGPRLVDRVHLTLTQQSRVAIRIARIASEVLARPELDRVHENADDHDLVLPSRGPLGGRS